jgi:hypothetical protein
MNDPVYVQPDGVRSYAQIHDEVVAGLSQLIGTAAGVQTSHGPRRVIPPLAAPRPTYPEPSAPSRHRRVRSRTESPRRGTSVVPASQRQRRLPRSRGLTNVDR